jgi:hypothetical protein
MVPAGCAIFDGLDRSNHNRSHFGSVYCSRDVFVGCAASRKTNSNCGSDCDAHRDANSHADSNRNSDSDANNLS